MREAEAVLGRGVVPAGEVGRHAFVNLVAEGLPVAAELDEGLATFLCGEILHDRHGHWLERLDHSLGHCQLLSLGRSGFGDMADVVVR